MNNTPILNNEQRLSLERKRTWFRRRGWYAYGEAILLTGMGIVAASVIFIDFTILHMVFSTYAEEGFHTTAFAASGVMVVLALHIVSQVLGSKVFDRVLATVAAICGLVFVAGTGMMVGNIVLTQGLGGLGEKLPDIAAFFDAARTAMDSYFGPSAFEEAMGKLTVPLFTAAVSTTFFLAVYLTKWLVTRLIRRVPVVAQKISDARQSEVLFGKVENTVIEQCEFQNRIANSETESQFWSDNPLIADVLVAVIDEELRPYDELIVRRRVTNPGVTDIGEPFIPYVDGVVPTDLDALEARLAEIRRTVSLDEIIRELNQTTSSAPAIPSN